LISVRTFILGNSIATRLRCKAIHLILSGG